MFEETIELFTNRLKSVILKDERMHDIPLAYLLQLDIPDYIKHYFDQEVELWIREEEEKFTSDRFDYDMPEVRMLIDQVFDRLKQNATFHITKFNHLLERAIKLELNYLIEPHRTLSQFLFKDSSEISTMEVYDTLKYFQFFEYYKTAISDYFNTKYLRRVTRHQFDQLMDQIDRNVFGENPVETTLGVIKSIMEFFSDAQGSRVDSLSLDILEHAFADRNLDEYVELVRQVRNKTDLSGLTFEQIEALIKDGIIPGAEGAGEVAEPTEIVGFEKVESIESRQVDVSLEDFEFSEMPEEAVEEEEEEEEFEEELEEELELEEEEEEEAQAEPEEKETFVLEETETPAEAEAAPQAAEETAAEQPEEEGEVSQVVADSLAEHLAKQISSDSPLEDLDPMIKGRIRRKIIKKLFKKKEDDFNDFVARLNALTDWKEASRLIDDEFYYRGINPYSKEAITFTDIIYMRFFPKDKYLTTSEDYERFS